MCNGDLKNFDTLCPVYGCASALTLRKDEYGLEVEMNYVWSTFSDITRNGRDRRGIVMEADPLDEASFKWLCQSMAFNSNRQSTTMKYRVTQEDPTIREPSSSADDNTGILFGSSAGKKTVSFLLNARFTPVLFAAMMVPALSL